jgi:hypothetical protein
MKAMRYSNTERLGVIATETQVTENIGWIFREQSIADIGIDAILEQVENGDPKGKFLAVQIKSGKSNFSINEKCLALYVSNIHYNYWINLNIPIILVAHLPDIKKTYWVQICKTNFKKTTLKWKIEIPKKQELNKKAKDRLTEILSDNKTQSFEIELYKGKIEPDTIYNTIQNVNRISNSTTCIVNLIDLLDELGSVSTEFNSKQESLQKDRLTDSDPIVKASLDNFGINLNLISERIKTEIDLFSKLFPIGFYAFEKVVLMDYAYSNEYDRIQTAQNSLEKLPDSITIALDGVRYLKSNISKLPNKYPVLKASKYTLIDTLDIIINEFTDAKNMAEKIISNINNSK